MQLIQETDYAREMEARVLPALKNKIEGSFEARDGQSLNYMLYPAPDARAAVVLIHGFSEFAGKYPELIYYLNRAGLSVFTYDQRGHGTSRRENENPFLTHIDRFDQYVEDLDAFMEKVARPNAGELPINLFGHSMGGAICALYLERHPDAIPRAVLSSPMIAIKTKHIPRPIARIVAATACALGRSADMPKLAHNFSAERSLHAPGVTPRSAYYIRLRASTPSLQNCTPSWGWIHSALPVTHRILSPKRLSRVQTRVLIFQAEFDRLVRARPIERLSTLLPQATLRPIPGTRHEIYLSPNPILEDYLNTLINFYQ